MLVVLPTPPFWLHIAMMRAGPWRSSFAGAGMMRSGRPVGPTSGCFAVRVPTLDAPFAISLALTFNPIACADSAYSHQENRATPLDEVTP